MKDMKHDIESADIQSIEGTTEQDSEYRELIQLATDFETLYAAIRKIDVVRGSEKDYSAERLIADINEIRQGNKEIGHITRTYGLRDKVEELLKPKV